MFKQLKTVISERQLVWISTLIISGFLFLVVLLGWFMLTKLDSHGRRTAVQTLHVLVHTTQNAVHIWGEDQKKEVESWANNPTLVKLVKEQFEVTRNAEELLRRPALTSMRNYFEDELEIHGFNDFFIITSDQINIGSMRDANIGKKNFIASQRENLFIQVFQGKTVFVSPIVPDITLRDKLTKGISSPKSAMFIATPIKDIHGDVFAALIGQIAPELVFNLIAQGGRLGKTGETYIFDSRGRILTKSRFEVDLQIAGILQPGQSSELNLVLHDPGANLLKGFRPKSPLSLQPLTVMALFFLWSVTLTQCQKKARLLDM